MRLRLSGILVERTGLVERGNHVALIPVKIIETHEVDDFFHDFQFFLMFNTEETTGTLKNTKI